MITQYTSYIGRLGLVNIMNSKRHLILVEYPKEAGYCPRYKYGLFDKVKNDYIAVTSSAIVNNLVASGLLVKADGGYKLKGLGK
jgi:hypothetical protein